MNNPKFIELEDLLDALFSTTGNTRASDNVGIQIPVNIRQTETDVVVSAAIPGVNKKDLNITVAENVLTLSGERVFASDISDKDFVRKEIIGGSFTRRVGLPFPVKTDLAKAEYVNGILTVSLPKTEAATTRKLEIN